MREIAYKASVKTLLSGEFHPSPGDYEPAYIESNGLKINRCNVIGTLVGDEMLDDGTGEIKAIKFNGPIGIEEGAIVRVIGKVREKETERYIAIEAIQPVDAKWIDLRKLELEKQPAVAEKVVEEVKPSVDKGLEEASKKAKGEMDIDIEEINV